MTQMRRQDCSVDDFDRILEIIKDCKTCRLGFFDNGDVYIVPLNFGYTHTNGKVTLYFHSATAGRKVALMEKGCSVSFEMDCAHNMDTSTELSCKFTMHYKSVMGRGRCREVTADEKIGAFRILMSHYTALELPFSEESLARTRMFAVDVDELSCKVH